MVVRSERDWMIFLIDGYLDEDIKHDDFVMKMQDLLRDTNDRSIQMCAAYWKGEIEEWDDWEDVGDDRDGWDLVQRVLLFLHSNEELKCKELSRWSLRQVVGGVLAVIWCAAIYRMMGTIGFDWGIYSLIQLCMNVLLLGLFWWFLVDERKMWEGVSKSTKRSQPFGSYGELRRVYETVGDFKKQKFKGRVHIQTGGWLKRLWDKFFLGSLLFYAVFYVVLIGALYFYLLCFGLMVAVGTLPIKGQCYSCNDVVETVGS
ncbi:hypothetical protein JD969_19235 [Planctomycetota bacterium]|nr:hypothetical protein JD969_19235 [Planctomycetota bacterium]